MNPTPSQPGAVRSLNFTPLAALVFTAALLAAPIAGCAVGPNFERPAVPAPQAWKWRDTTLLPAPAMPAITSAPSALPAGSNQTRDSLYKTQAFSIDAWWTAFGEPVLDSLEAAALLANQDLRAALARVAEARTQVTAARSFLFPELRVNASATRSEFSANRPSPFPVDRFYQTNIQLPIEASYEIDIWGRLRRQLESATDTYKATAAESDAVRLTLTADIARLYFSIRTTDTERRILDRTLAARRENLALAQSRFASGLTTQLDVRQAETELASVESQLIDLARSRAESELALSTLCGAVASGFTVRLDTLQSAPPPMPAMLPADLLRRRPDLAQAELNAAAANAQIGSSIAALLPRLNLVASGGLQSQALEKLFAAESRAWSIGVGISFPIFDGLRTAENVKAAEARYERTAAIYRQTALVAFREVESALANVRLRAEQSAAQRRAAVASEQAAQLVRERYTRGLVNYIDVVNSERTVLETERQAAQILGQRLIASVQLVKALGGGWQPESLPK